MSSTTTSLPPLVLPAGVSSHYITSPQNDLEYHYLSAGKRGSPLVLLYHGFPETGYCWRHILPILAARGYFAVAPDTRGSGRTTVTSGASFEYTAAGHELHQQTISNNVRDAVIFVCALGYERVHCLVGHDAGGVLVPAVALFRPDLVERLVVASHPYTGPPKVQFDIPSDAPPPQIPAKPSVHEALARLPEPRKHYKWYYAGPDSAKELHEPKEGVVEFLRSYYYLKSASWPGNKPHTLEAWNAENLAKMPFYYVMPLDCGMREACRRQLEISGGEKADVSSFMSEEELRCYAAEWERTGFRGALNWYRISTQPVPWQRDLQTVAGLKLKMPTLMLLGRQDWGSYQEPGVLENMGKYCDRYVGERWIENAGHWMQQEKVDDVAGAILEVCDIKL